MMAMSLVHKPDFLFLDEPTSAVDPDSRADIWRILQKLRDEKREMITFLTTHHLEEAELLSNEIKVLVNGKIYC